MINQKLLTF